MINIRKSLVSTLPLAALLLALAGCSTPSDREVAKGNHALSKLDLRTAFDHYDEAIRLDPEQTEAYYKRGRIRWQRGRFEDAIPDFDRAIGLDPFHTWARFFRGASHVSLHQYELAVDDFDLVTATSDLNDADQVRAYTWRAIALYYLNRFEESLEDHTRCITLHPEVYVHRLDRAWVYEVLERYDDAIADYEHALDLIADSVLTLQVENRVVALRKQYTSDAPVPTPTNVSD